MDGDNVPTAEFAEQVREALEHLYDFPHLQGHALTRYCDPEPGSGATTSGQRLRRELLSAIESLDADRHSTFRSPSARLYDLLHLHYVEGMTVEEAAQELAVSKRQAYRDLRRGVEGVARVLWERFRERQPALASTSSLDAELERLEIRPRSLDLRELLEQAMGEVRQLASARQVSLRVRDSNAPVKVSGDALVSRQILVSALSQAIQRARPGEVEIGLDSSEGVACLSVTFSPPPGPPAQASVERTVAAQLARKQGWKLESRIAPDGRSSLVLHAARRGEVLLVIDDNEGLIELVSRYLTGHGCRVAGATSAEEGLRLARELHPRAILLDVLMPDADGWQVLQTLRTAPQTSAVPVIVCSVLNDPELARSLGASAVVPKPVSRDDLLRALRP